MVLRVLLYALIYSKMVPWAVNQLSCRLTISRSKFLQVSFYFLVWFRFFELCFVVGTKHGLFRMILGCWFHNIFACNVHVTKFLLVGCCSFCYWHFYFVFLFVFSGLYSIVCAFLFCWRFLYALLDCYRCFTTFITG